MSCYFVTLMMTVVMLAANDAMEIQNYGVSALLPLGVDWRALVPLGST